MKKLICLPLATVMLLVSRAQMQSFTGYRTSNYAGVNGVFFNPSSIADSRYKWDANLFSVNAGLANNKAAYNLSDAINNFDEEEIKSKLLSGNGSIDAQVNADILGPSFMLSLSPEHSVALTTRLRTIANIREMDGSLVNSIIDAGNDAELPYTFSSNKDSRISVNGWTEFGLSYARVLYSDAYSFIKAGATIKYLAGVGNTYAQLKGLSGTIEDDPLNGPYLASGAQGRLGIGVGGINISSLGEAENSFEFNGSGPGFDLGFTYEYRPGDETYTDEAGDTRINATKYKLKFGLALLDVGKIKYDRDISKSGTYNLDVKTGDRFYLSQLDGKELDEYKQVTEDPANNPRYFTNAPGNDEASYKVMLPTSLAADIDYNVQGDFYVNLAAQVSLSKKESVYDAASYNGISLTPRYERKKLGVYLPLNYNSISSFNAGFGLSAGPVFIGSGSIISALIGESKQADVYFGTRFGLLKNK